MHLCLGPVLYSVPTGVGGLAGFRSALEGVSNSSIFIGIPLRQSLWCYVERDWLIGNVSVSYVTLVPWRWEWRRNILSPQLLYHRCMAGAHSLGSSVKNWCAFARQLSLACLVNTQKWLGSLARSHYVSHSGITSPFPSSGNEGYIRNRDYICYANNESCIINA